MLIRKKTYKALMDSLALANKVNSEQAREITQLRGRNSHLDIALEQCRERLRKPEGKTPLSISRYWHE